MILNKYNETAEIIGVHDVSQSKKIVQKFVQQYMYSLIQYQYNSMHRRIFKSIDNHSENHADEAVVIELDLYV